MYRSPCLVESCLMKRSWFGIVSYVFDGKNRLNKQLNLFIFEIICFVIFCREFLPSLSVVILV